MSRPQKETDSAKEAERLAVLSFYGEQASKARREEDNRVLSYAERLMDECRREGRPTYALEKGVDVSAARGEYTGFTFTLLTFTTNLIT